MGKRVLLKDIAAKLGVSIALVSYVLNNKKGKVSPAMADKIRKTASDMDYLPNLVAKSLQSGKTHTIGLVVADISNAFFSRLARIMEHEAEKHGYTVIFGSTDENADKSRLLVEAFLNRQVDGLIIAPAAGTEDQLRLLRKKKTPFVLIDRFFENLNANSVRINNFDAAYKATEHLITTGRSRITLVNFKETGLSHFSERANGFKAALKAHGLPHRMLTVDYGKIQPDMGLQMKSMLTSKSKTDAIFFATHTLGIEGLKELKRAGIGVPEQVSIISFDENDAFDLYDPPVSYIRQPLDTIGTESVRLLIDNISKPSARHKIIELDAEMVFRQSSAIKKSLKKV